MKKQLLLAALILGAASTASAMQELNLDVNGYVDRGYTRLYNAACAGDTVLCAVLLNAGARINDFTRDGLVFYGATALQGAACSGKADTCEYLLQRGADINATRSRKETALHWAAQHGYNAVITVLLKYKDRINTRWENGCTPLHEAAKRGLSTTCELLIQNRADLNITEEDIRSALDLLPANVRTAASLLRFQNIALQRVPQQQAQQAPAVAQPADSSSLSICALM